MIKYKNSYLVCCLLILTIIFLNACKKEPYKSEKELKSERVVLVLMEANNSLRPEAFASINNMELGIQNGLDLFVYIKTESQKSYLLKIKPDSDQYRIKSDTIHVFYNTGFSTVESILEPINVVKDKMQDRPLGIVFWSHATSWAPARKQLKTKSFGDDRGEDVDIQYLAHSIPKVDFIMFDACSMGSIEVLYEFRDKADFIIASPTETLAESFPYHLMTQYLFQDEQALINVCDLYFQYYNSYPDLRKSATISLYRASKFQELANQMAVIYENNQNTFTEFQKDQVQRLDFTYDFPIPVYDFLHYIQNNFSKENVAIALQTMQELILFSKNTDYFLGVPINHFSGLSIYIPDKNSPDLLDYYKNLKWYNDSKLYLLYN